MRFATIASGSAGNCVYVGSGNRNILIDVGIPLKRIEAGLSELGLSVDDLDGIFITHEHSDHIGGLGVLLRKYQVPVYLTAGTFEYIKSHKVLGSFNEELLNVLVPGFSFGFGDMTIKSFSVSHDAAEPVMYRVSAGENSVAVVTDTGAFDEDLIKELEGIDGLILEANHDIRMLQVGPYPYALKRRIAGRDGHLSNEAAGCLLCRLASGKLKHVLLGHLSPTNNYPELALEAVRAELSSEGVQFETLDVAPRSELSMVIEL